MNSDGRKAALIRYHTGFNTTGFEEASEASTFTDFRYCVGDTGIRLIGKSRRGLACFIYKLAMQMGTNSALISANFLHVNVSAWS